MLEISFGWGFGERQSIRTAGGVIVEACMQLQSPLDLGIHMHKCLSKLILFGEKSLQRVVSNYLAHYQQERNHQGKDNLLLFPVAAAEGSSRGAISCRERLGGLLK